MNDLERVLRELARLTERLVRLPKDAVDDGASIDAQQDELRSEVDHLRPDRPPEQRAS